MKYVQAIGLDLGINNVGIARVGVQLRESGNLWVQVQARYTIKDGDDRSLELHDRLRAIHVAIFENVKIMSLGDPILVGIENFSRGSTYRREEMGAVFAAAVTAFPRSYPIALVTPKQAKAIACPRWPGFNGDNWRAAGRTTKFKLSMPGKDDILNGLYRRFGVALHDEHQADAACVAIAAIAARNLWVKKRLEDTDGEASQTSRTKARHR